MGVREYALRPRTRIRADRRRVCWPRSTRATRVVFVNTPHNPTGSVMAADEQRKLAEALAARGIPLIVDEVYHPLYYGAPVAERQRSCPTPSCSAISPRRCRMPGLRIGWLIDRDAQRRERVARHAQLFHDFGFAADRGGRRACAGACAGEILGAAADGVARQSGAADGVHARASRARSAGRRPPAAPRAFPWLRDGRDARPLCEALAKAGVLVAPGDCFEMPAHFRIGFGALT